MSDFEEIQLRMPASANEEVYMPNRNRRVLAGLVHTDHDRYNRIYVSLTRDEMDSWKKAAIVGSISAATILFMKRKYAAGVLATGVGLGVLASEYPEKFEKVRRALPEYFERGMQLMEMAGRAGRRITNAAGRSAVDAWEEFGD